MQASRPGRRTAMDAPPPAVLHRLLQAYLEHIKDGLNEDFFEGLTAHPPTVAARDRR